MINFYLISLFSAFVSGFALIISFLIFNKIFDEKYKRPWLFILISTIIFSLNNILIFINGFYNFKIGTSDLTNAIILSLEFISISILLYGLLLEYFILKYIKGKFVKFKFIPVQEGNLAGNLDIDVSKGNGYLAYKKDRNFLLKEVSKAVKIGFEGFFIVELNPKEIRTKYNIVKTPIAWITPTNIDDSSSLKNLLDENSDSVEPLNLNSIITYVDNFLEASTNPFIVIELNLILKYNNFSIVEEFLRYVSSRVTNYNGIFLALINEDVISIDNLKELKGFLKELL